MIYATVGTMFLDFPRLLNKLDEFAAKTGRDILIQKGMGETVLRHCRSFDFKPHDEVVALQSQAEVIVCHGGIGCVLDALEVRRPLIVVPRLKSFNEHLTDHQIEVAEAVQRRGWGKMILDISGLEDALLNPPAVPESYRPARHRLLSAVRETVDRVAALREA